MTEMAMLEQPVLRRPRSEIEIAVDESLPLALQRITTDLFSRAIADLRARDRTRDDGVHAARKKMKRLRAMIRLPRDAVGYRSYRDENVVLRDTARPLAAVRDAKVLIETLRAVRSRYEDLLADHTFATTEAWLRERHSERLAVFSDRLVHAAIINLGAARSRFAAYPVETVVPDEYASIAPGIQRVYRRGHRAHSRSTQTWKAEHLHEWRKRVKYLRYHMEFLTPLQPRLIGSLAGELDRLGEVLGDDHDLVVLGETLQSNVEACPDDRERWLLMALIYEKRAELHDQARRLGAALYSEPPTAFVARLGGYWDSSRS